MLDSMVGFSQIVIIYNPQSTGPSRERASELTRQLDGAVDCNVTQVATEYSGHAEVLARHYAQHLHRPLLISVSGDGGYHEVVNGVMSSTGAVGVVTSLYPAGNANDHYRMLSQESLSANLTNQEVSAIDLLRVEITQGSTQLQRFAHSYCGIGLTSHAGRTLNQHDLNLPKQAGLVLRSLFRAPSAIVQVAGKRKRYDSLVCANIGGMAKLLSISDASRVDDGVFEVIAFAHRSRLLALPLLLKAATVGIKEDYQAERLRFQALHDMPIQLDGEVYDIGAGAHVTITAQPQSLPCII